jgi:two-component system phosphate regulon response regulator PhoB
LRTLRSLVFRFQDISAFAAALEDAPGALPLPDGEAVADGEWVLATFEIGSRKRATAAAARGVRAAGDPHLEFERRDWDRLVAFVAARSEHMRAARPLGPVSTRSPSSEAPATRAPDTDAPPLSSEAPPSTALESTRVPFGARVLLLDDDVRTREEVRVMLAEMGLSVELVETTSEASSRMRDVAFDALVMDFHAPGIDPLEFVRSLRRDPLRAPIPVLILSDRPSSREVVDVFASGADDFLPKPIRAPELGARIFGLLRRARLARVATSPRTT